MSEEECDGLLIGLAQRAGGIEPLLHSLFSFLKRKTDFYHIQRPGDRIGFPPGKAKHLVLEAFNRFASHEEAIAPAKKDLESRGERLVPHEQGAGAQGPPPASQAKVVNEKKGGGKKGVTKEEKKEGEAKAAAERGQGDSKAVAEKDGGEEGGERKREDVERGQGAKTAEKAGGESREAEGGGKPGGDGNFVTYNGGDGKGYRWSQTIDEVVVFLDCSPYSSKVKGKDVQCKVGKKSIQVSLALSPPSSDPPPELIKGELFGEVLQDDVVWHIEDGKFVTVTMEKRRKIWWKSALVGDEEIDTQKVDSTCSIDDYDQPTQAAIQKLMFDQHQKIQGKPTSDELQQHELLRKAWDAEGSPFQGTPFDPSAINFSGQMPPMPDSQ